MQNRNRKKTARTYSSESLMLRGVLGVLLIAVGVLTLLSIIGGLNGSAFTVIRQVAQGLGGGLCLGLPLFFVWGGALTAFSARRHAPVRPFLLLLACYFCVLSIVNLFSGVGTQGLMEYAVAVNQSSTPPEPDPNGYWPVIKTVFRVCKGSGAFGGALGVLLAWPLLTLGQTMAAVILSLLALICILFFSRFDVIGLVRKLRESSDERLARREQEKQQREYQKQLEAAQAQQEKQRRIWQSPAYQRVPEQQAAVQPVAYAMPQQGMPFAPAQPVELYDEMIVPETPSDAKPSEWKPEGLLRKKRPATAESAPLPKDKDTRKAITRMEEIRKRKEELQQALAAEEAAAPPAAMPSIAQAAPIPAAPPARKPSATVMPAPSAEPAAPPAVPSFIPPAETAPDQAYKRPAAPPKTTSQQQIPMSGVRLDTPNLKLPEKKAADPAAEVKQRPPYAYPTLELLNLKQQKRPDTRDIDAQNAVKLEQTLDSFGIPARVQRVTHGPAVTRFELGLTSSGVNVKRIMGIADNIALDMAANGGVRIEIPIPGTNLFGIEVPNKEIIGVTLAEVLTSPEMTGAKSPLSVALGRDIAGKPIICDLAKMPHLLIAGQTGSGKSVCINSIINSLLYRATPEQVRMIMIDPKVVELQCYNVVPHLLIPVVSDPHKASGALAWAVQEMLDRYHKMQCKGVRELSAYNAKLVEGEEPLPRIVIIIDELADLMLACKKEVEESIIRLAQLARASGIHMVVATQRPTVDVITGLIKSNIPSRIAFAVSSNIDSRTILDTVGAEKLLGKGDMFYFPTGASAPLRVQGCYLSDSEIENVVDYIGEHSQTDFNPTIAEVMESATEADNTPSADDAGDEGVDERLQEAVEMVLTDGQASISMLQRRMKIGYARAGRLIDDMAARGIVSKSVGSKPREILMSYEEYLRQKEALFGGRE